MFNRGLLFGFLFLAPFAGCGAYTTYLIVDHLYQSASASSWVPTDAKIRSVRINRTTKAGSDGDSVSYVITSSYSYSFQGRKYNASKVGIEDSAPFKLALQSRRDELFAHAKSKEPFTCYVNPENPAESVLYSGPVWGHIGFLSIFSIVFGGVGFGGMFLMLKAVGLEAEEKRRKYDFPDQPWRWNPVWERGSLTPQTKKQALVMWGLAIFWNAISSPLFFAIPEELERGNFLILIGGLFPLVGFGLLYVAIKKTLIARKFQTARLLLETNPGILGGEIRATLHFAQPLEGISNASLALTCLETVRDSDGSTERIAWQTTQSVGTGSGMLSSLPVRFSIPIDTRPTDGDDKVKWNVTFQATMPGIDPHIDFEVPVFRTSQSSEQITKQTVDNSRQAEHVTPTPQSSRELELLEISPRAEGGISLSVPTMLRRRPVATLGWSSFACVWTGITVLLALAGLPLAFPIVFGLFAMIMLLGSYHSLVSRSRIGLSRDGCELRSAGLLFTSNKHYPLADIVGVDSEISSTTQVGTKQTSTYRIQLKLKGEGLRSRVTLIDSIRSETNAQHLVSTFRSALGLSQ